MPERNRNRPPYTLVEMLRIIPRSSLPIGVAWNKCEEAADRIEELETRITELEAALRDVLPYVDTCNSWHREAQAKGYAALEGGKEDG